MMDHVDDYIMIQNLLPKQLCRALIRESSLPEKKWSKHKWYNYDTNVHSSMPEKELDIIHSTQEQFQELGKYLEIAIKNYQEKYSTRGEKMGTSWIKHVSQVRFNRYRAGMRMRIHQDHIQSLFDGKLKGIPIISIVGLLNDNYDGGQFMCRGNEIKLARGDILLFPSNFMYPHEVREVTKGIRYSFVSWAF
jgi:predicted 2-oxoglutarate/Fe(II)-dependent dioxygenase YbiX